MMIFLLSVLVVILAIIMIVSAFERDEHPLFYLIAGAVGILFVLSVGYIF